MCDDLTSVRKLTLPCTAHMIKIETANVMKAKTEDLESSDLRQAKSRPDPEYGWLPKFSGDFLVQRYIYDKTFIKQIRLVFTVRLRSIRTVLLSRFCPSVRPSVGLSNACIVTKRKHLAKSSFMTNRKLPTSFPTNLRWTSYVAPNSQRGPQKRFFSIFRIKKNGIFSKKVCYKVSLRENFQRQSCK